MKSKIIAFSFFIFLLIFMPLRESTPAPVSIPYQVISDTELATQNNSLNGPVIPPTISLSSPDPEFIYVRIANILNVRSGPGTNFPLVYRPGFGNLLLKRGAVCKVKNQKIAGEDGRVWYEINPAGSRKRIGRPGRVTGKWFIAQEYTEEVKLKKTFNVFADTKLGDKRIEIDLSEQTLRAYEQDRLVLETLVSTGRIGYATPYGNYRIIEKLVTQYMQGLEFDLPCVPFVMYFTRAGHALHGAYWHDNFGEERSHGCVNVPPGEIDEWLYWWSGDLGEVEIIIRR